VAQEMMTVSNRMERCGAFRVEVHAGRYAGSHVR